MSITKHVLERDKTHFWVDCEHFGNLEFNCSIQDFIFLLSANRKLLMHAIFNHITPIQFADIVKTKANI